MHAPLAAQERRIFDFLRSKEQWILRKVREAENARAVLEQKRFENGHSFLFLGRKYPLEIFPDGGQRVRCDFDGTKWTVRVPADWDQEKRHKGIRDQMALWYQAQAKEILGGRLFHFARVLGVEPKEIAIRTQKRVWGNCDYRRQRIHLNWLIILAPREVVDYVVVHELCHLLVPNHSRRFWKKVEQILPDFKSRRKWLKEHFLDMTLP